MTDMLKNEGTIGTDQWLVSQYLRFGSVEEVLRAYRYNLPISIASYHRLVNRYGIIKNAGRREVSFSELLYFFAQKALEPSVGIETLYFSKIPPSFQTSLATLHRTYKNIISKNTRRSATALIIRHPDFEGKILLGQESTTAKRFGKFKGDFSVPMTFSEENETSSRRILQVLQQEVLTPLACRGLVREESEIARQLGLKFISPKLYFDILDVRVSVYDITLPEVDKNIGSFRVENLQFFSAIDVISGKLDLPFRVGVYEMIRKFFDFGSQKASICVSDLNKVLIA